MPWVLGFRVLGFRVSGVQGLEVLKFRGFGVRTLGFKVSGLGALGFRGLGLRILLFKSCKVLSFVERILQVSIRYRLGGLLLYGMQKGSIRDQKGSIVRVRGLSVWEFYQRSIQKFRSFGGLGTNFCQWGGSF